MYYYIVQSQLSSRQQQTVKRIKELVSELGIAGEFALASPARSIEELAEMGLEKGYTTFVCVGDEAVANRIVGRILEYRLAFGVIPFDFQGNLARMAAVANVREACESLKHRRLKQLGVTQINNSVFLTDGRISSAHPKSIALIVDDLHIDGDFTDVTIGADVTVELLNRGGGGTRIFKGLQWFFGRDEPNLTFSRFHGERIRISAADALDVAVAGEVVAKTPVTVTAARYPLNLIVKRANVADEMPSAELESS